MATSTVERTKEQVGLEKQNNVAIEKDLSNKLKMNNGNLLGMKLEKMKEAQETAQKEQQELKIEQEKIREQKAKLEAE